MRLGLWICLFALLAGCSREEPAPAQSQPLPPIDLFSGQAIAHPPAKFREQAIAKRHRFARINPAVFERLAGPDALIRLNLFPDLVATAVITTNQNNLGLSTNYLGHLQGTPGAMVRFTQKGHQLTGTVALPGKGNFMIGHVRDNIHVVFEVKPIKPTKDD